MTFVPGPGDALSRFSSESEPQRGGDSELLSLPFCFRPESELEL